MKNGHVEEKYYLALQGHGPERVSSQKQSSQNGLMRKSSPFFKNGGSQKKPTVGFFFGVPIFLNGLGGKIIIKMERRVRNQHIIPLPSTK